jgi:hypothetical protein
MRKSSISDRHPKTNKPTDMDLRENPGISTFKGAIRGRKILDQDESLEGDNTFEGDVESDVTPRGGVDPDQTGLPTIGGRHGR